MTTPSTESARARRAEDLVFAAIVLGVGVAIAGSIAASRRGPSDLDFDGTHREVESVIRRVGPARLMPVGAGAVSGPAGRVSFDTLGIPDTTAGVPSLSPFGFLREQRSFANGDAVRHAWRVAHGLVPAREARPIRSLLDLEFDGEGRSQLAARTQRGWYRVVAPGRTGTSPTVLASDAATLPTLIGRMGMLALGPQRDTATLDRVRCGTIPEPPRIRVQCGTAGAGGRGGRAPLALRPSDYGSWDVWREGSGTLLVRGVPALDSTRQVVPGDALYARETGLIAAVMATHDAIAATQRVNGRLRWIVHADRTLRVFATAANGLGTREDGAPDAVQLAVDRQLSERLGRGTEDFRRRYPMIEELSIIVADVATAEVRALAESGDEVGREPLAFRHVPMGSMLKPLLFYVILAQLPALVTHQVPYAGARLESIEGSRLRPAMGNARNGCGDAQFGVVRAITCSSNQFAISLLLASIRHANGAGAIGKGGRVSREALEASPLGRALPTMFRGVQVEMGQYAERSALPWEPDSSHPAGLSVPTDGALLPWAAQAWLLPPPIDAEAPAAAIRGASDVNTLARFAIGAGENRWTPIWALEAYLRIATSREVNLTFWARDLQRSAAQHPAVSDSAGRAAAVVRDGLRGVATTGTAKGLDRGFAGLAGPGVPLAVLAKTGTLNEPGGDGNVEGVHVKSMAVLVGRQVRAGEWSAPLECGSGAIIVVRFSRDWMRAHRGSALPEVHRAFASEVLAPALRQSWARRGTCQTAVNY